MKITQEIKKYIEQSVLCWLATVSTEGFPNVSPKEIFKAYEQDKIIVANIASPQTIENIRTNQNVCISFIDVFVQKGYQIKGTARIVDHKNVDFLPMESELVKMTGGNFPFKTIIEIRITEAKPIVAPKYVLYPETTEEEQTINAKKAYGL